MIHPNKVFFNLSFFLNILLLFIWHFWSKLSQALVLKSSLLRVLTCLFWCCYPKKCGAISRFTLWACWNNKTFISEPILALVKWLLLKFSSSLCSSRNSKMPRWTMTHGIGTSQSKDFLSCECVSRLLHEDTLCRALGFILVTLFFLCSWHRLSHDRTVVAGFKHKVLSPPTPTYCEVTDMHLKLLTF